MPPMLPMPLEWRQILEAAAAARILALEPPSSWKRTVTDPRGLTPATAAEKSAGRAHGPEWAQAAQRVPRRGPRSERE